MIRTPLYDFRFGLRISQHGRGLAVAAVLTVMQASATVRLQYSISPRVEENRLVVHAVLDMAGISGSETELVVPSTWGGAEGRAN